MGRLCRRAHTGDFNRLVEVTAKGVIMGIDLSRVFTDPADLADFVMRPVGEQNAILDSLVEKGQIPPDVICKECTKKQRARRMRDQIANDGAALTKKGKRNA